MNFGTPCVSPCKFYLVASKNVNWKVSVDGQVVLAIEGKSMVTVTLTAIPETYNISYDASDERGGMGDTFPLQLITTPKALYATTICFLHSGCDIQLQFPTPWPTHLPLNVEMVGLRFISSQFSPDSRVMIIGTYAGDTIELKVVRMRLYNRFTSFEITAAVNVLELKASVHLPFISQGNAVTQ